MSGIVKDNFAALMELYDLADDCGLMAGPSDNAKEVSLALEDVFALPLQPSEIAAVRRLMMAVVYRLMFMRNDIGWERASAVMRHAFDMADRNASMIDEREGITLTPDAII